VEKLGGATLGEIAYGAEGMRLISAETLLSILVTFSIVFQWSFHQVREKAALLGTEEVKALARRRQTCPELWP
jgi:hypothetical protein